MSRERIATSGEVTQNTWMENTSSHPVSKSHHQMLDPTSGSRMRPAQSRQIATFQALPEDGQRRIHRQQVMRARSLDRRLPRG